MSSWKYFITTVGGQRSAVPFIEINAAVSTAEEAAQKACKDEYIWCGGDEREEGEEFDIVVISPDGVESRFRCWHEYQVVHNVRPAEPRSEVARRLDDVREQIEEQPYATRVNLQGRFSVG